MTVWKTRGHTHTQIGALSLSCSCNISEAWHKSSAWASGTLLIALLENNVMLENWWQGLTHHDSCFFFSNSSQCFVSTQLIDDCLLKLCVVFDVAMISWPDCCLWVALRSSLAACDCLEKSFWQSLVCVFHHWGQSQNFNPKASKDNTLQNPKHFFFRSDPRLACGWHEVPGRTSLHGLCQQHACASISTLLLASQKHSSNHLLSKMGSAPKQSHCMN